MLPDIGTYLQYPGIWIRVRFCESATAAGGDGVSGSRNLIEVLTLHSSRFYLGTVGSISRFPSLLLRLARGGQANWRQGSTRSLKAGAIDKVP